MDKKFRIAFQGAVRSEVDPMQARKQAAIRLKASAAQIERIFSGARVILKQNLDASQIEIYQRALEKLGMIVSVEEMIPLSPQRPAPVPFSHELSSLTPQLNTPDYSHFERTHINLARAEALLNGYMNEPSSLTHTTFNPETETETETETGVVANNLQDNGIQASVSANEHQIAPSVAEQSVESETPVIQPDSTSIDHMPSIPAAARLAISAPAESTPPIEIKPITVTTHFQCNHCGTEHQLELQLQFNLTPIPRQARDAG